VSVVNASVVPDQTEYDYGTNATYTCVTGYERAIGDLVRMCQANQSWSGSALVCQSMRTFCLR